MRRLVPVWCLCANRQSMSGPYPSLTSALPSMSLDPLTQGTAKAMALRIVQFLAIMFTAIVTLFGSSEMVTARH